MPGAEEWWQIARLADENELRERILTGYKHGKPFTPYVPTIQLPAGLDWVLDFGCGLGRNFPFLASVAGHVVGFDLPPMIERCRRSASESIDLLSDDWGEIRSRRFDLVFAQLVLQHIDSPSCRSYLLDFARMAPATYLLSRVRSDFGDRVPDLVAESDAFSIEEYVQVEHDPTTNQLRVLDRIPLAEAGRLKDDAHVEVFLRSALVG